MNVHKTAPLKHIVSSAQRRYPRDTRGYPAGVVKKPIEMVELNKAYACGFLSECLHVRETDGHVQESRSLVKVGKRKLKFCVIA